MCKLISVYGTLRRGGPANGYLKGAKYIGKDTLPAQLFALGWFPGVKHSEHHSTIVDVYEIPENDGPFLQAMDRYEGYAPRNPEESLFVRKKTLLNERNEETYYYEYCHDVSQADEIITGDWFNRVNERG